MFNKIAISGSAGTGTTTLSKELLKLLPEWRYTNGGGIMREFAKKENMEIGAFIKHLKDSNNTLIDKKIDAEFVRYAQNTSTSNLLEGRFVAALLAKKKDEIREREC